MIDIRGAVACEHTTQRALVIRGNTQRPSSGSRGQTSRLNRGLLRHVFCPEREPWTPPKVYRGESVSAFTLKAGTVRVAIVRAAAARAVTTRATPFILMLPARVAMPLELRQTSVHLELRVRPGNFAVLRCACVRPEAAHYQETCTFQSGGRGDNKCCTAPLLLYKPLASWSPGVLFRLRGSEKR